MKTQTFEKAKAQSYASSYVGSYAARTLIAVLVSIFGFTGCQKEQGATAVGRGDAGAGIWAQANGIGLNGNLTDPSASQNEWQEAVSGFIEAKYPPEYLGYVSTTATNGTGALIGGRVELTAGALNSSGAASGAIRSDSKFLVEIRDEYTGRIGANGMEVMPLYRNFDRASGSVQGNKAIITFTDGYGSVTLDGTFSGQLFSGSFSYRNTKNWDPAENPWIGTVGTFRLPTCQFFRCQ